MTHLNSQYPNIPVQGFRRGKLIEYKRQRAITLIERIT